MGVETKHGPKLHEYLSAAGREGWEAVGMIGAHQSAGGGLSFSNARCPRAAPRAASSQPLRRDLQEPIMHFLRHRQVAFTQQAWALALQVQSPRPAPGNKDIGPRDLLLHCPWIPYAFTTQRLGPK